MKFILLASLIFSSYIAHAEADKSNVAAMLDEMVKNRVISAEEAAKAKVRMETMSSTAWSDLNSKAEAQASRMPASVDATNSKDVDGAQLQQISDDMKKMVPEQR